MLSKRGEALAEVTDTSSRTWATQRHAPEAREKRGLRNAGIAFVIMLAIYLALLLTPGSPLRAEDGSVLMSPLLLNVGIVIAVDVRGGGLGLRARRRDHDHRREVPEAMAKGLAGVTPVLVLFFAAAQFTAYFQ
ncbi:AbgT family transporter [Kocuria rhizophila]|nr:AbgT family transporter [Kocuria rhizophila]